MASNGIPARSIFVYLLLGILLIACAEFALFLVGCGTWKRSQGDQIDDENKKVHTREQFEQLIMGKTENEVLEAVGKPYTTSRANGVAYWHYKGCTLDPLTKQTDSDVQVILKNGHVSAVNY